MDYCFSTMLVLSYNLQPSLSLFDLNIILAYYVDIFGDINL